jgi:hypothetical protein
MAMRTEMMMAATFHLNTSGKRFCSDSSGSR